MFPYNDFTQNHIITTLKLLIYTSFTFFQTLMWVIWSQPVLKKMYQGSKYFHFSEDLFPLCWCRGRDQNTILLVLAAFYNFSKYPYRVQVLDIGLEGIEYDRIIYQALFTAGVHIVGVAVPAGRNIKRFSPHRIINMAQETPIPLIFLLHSLPRLEPRSRDCTHITLDSVWTAS